MRPLLHLNAAANRVINLLANCKSPSQINQIQAQIILQNLYEDTTIAYHFITACQCFGLLDSAHLLCAQIHRPHVFICNALMKCFSQTQSPRKAVAIYTQMCRNSISPNNYSFPFVLKALADLRDKKQGECVHTQIIKLGQLDDIYVRNSLLNVYASCGDMNLCCQVFDEMPQRDVVSWTVVITGYREAGKLDDALISFEQMQYAGFEPNQVTMVNALAACSSCGALEMGIWIHDFIRRKGWELDVVLGSSLIDMYGKCGKIEEGLAVFKSMKERNAFTWNAIIKGLALAKSGEEAIRWFSRMEQEGIKPDQITLIGVLCACSHSGLVQIGEQIFSSLVNGKYGFLPNVKHYGCMVDLFARSGYLEEALQIINEMAFEPTISMWGALLAGCRAHGNLELSEFASWKAIELEPENGAYYNVLSNVYALMGRWSDAANIRSLMKERGLIKDLGCSSVELQPENYVHELVA